MLRAAGPLMCGFAAWFDPQGGSPDPEALAAAASTLAHRGPDDAAFHVEPGLGFAFRRLSIVDVAGGAQPLSNEDGTIWIAYNGEIYNHESLRGQLEAKGHRYRTRSDTESIVHAYEEWGDECVERLRGMFAFALWDRRRRRLLLARDRVGIKPLYLTRAGSPCSATDRSSISLLPPSPSPGVGAGCSCGAVTVTCSPPRSPLPGRPLRARSRPRS